VLAAILQSPHGHLLEREIVDSLKEVSESSFGESHFAGSCVVVCICLEIDAARSRLGGTVYR
jgi:hypothetical protein